MDSRTHPSELILIVYISRIAEPWWLTVMAVGGFFTGILFGPFTGWVADRFFGAGLLVWLPGCILALRGGHCVFPAPALSLP